LIQHANMKQDLAGLFQRYVSALRKHLKQGSDLSLLPALRLGSEVAAPGREPQELTRIHERALTILEPASRKAPMVQRAKIFLTLTTMSSKRTYRAARANKIPLDQLSAPVNGTTASRNAVHENAGNKCLEESLQLQEHLRQLTHHALAAQEAHRQKLGCGLQDEIAQTLLGLNVRLLALKQKARSNPKGLKKEIASTRRLVVQSAKFVRQFARRLDTY